MAESQDIPKEREDPGRAWIDLVLAFKSGDPARVREVLAQAKASQWTHESYSDAMIQDSESEDGDGPGGWATNEDEFYEE